MLAHPQRRQSKLLKAFARPTAAHLLPYIKDCWQPALGHERQLHPGLDGIFDGVVHCVGCGHSSFTRGTRILNTESSTFCTNGVQSLNAMLALGSCLRQASKEPCRHQALNLQTSRHQLYKISAPSIEQANTEASRPREDPTRVCQDNLEQSQQSGMLR